MPAMEESKHFSPLLLLIADEIGGVPVGRGGLNLQSNDSALSLTELIGMRLSTRISLLKFKSLFTDFLSNRCLAREEYKKGAALYAAPFLWLKVVSVKIRLLFYFRSDKYRPVILQCWFPRQVLFVELVLR